MRPAESLRSIVDYATPALFAISEDVSARRPASGTWCPREIVGHLIDSAIVNAQRIVRARSQDDLVFEGYDQDAWVAAQAWSSASWRDLVRLWRLLNLQVARAIDETPEPALARVHTRHSLDRIAFRVVRAEDPVTLAFLVDDYALHLLHHLRQVLGAGWQAPRGPA
jgi:hypothetical protein